MVNVRGVNVYPSAVESVVRRFGEVAEYRATVATAGSLRELSVEIELVERRRWRIGRRRRSWPPRFANRSA